MSYFKLNPQQEAERAEMLKHELDQTQTHFAWSNEPLIDGFPLSLVIKNLSKDEIGMCPKCKEYTTAVESCCGQGAIVEGDLIKDKGNK